MKTTPDGPFELSLCVAFDPSARVNKYLIPQMQNTAMHGTV